MKKNLKKRISTSLILLFLLSLMFINDFIFLYCLIVIGVFSILEFIKINSIIFKKNKVYYTLINFLFIAYIFFTFSALITLSSLVNFKIFIFLILLTCIASDTGGYVFGKIFKGPKLTRISPKKTISGSIGSFLSSLIVSFLLIYYLTNSINFYILILGFLVSSGCQLGDLFFSYLKRKSSLKDTGNFLPGHGGVLDRIDGMLLGIPLGLIILLLI
jgi:phosphatidate cytidylyltransferase